MQNVPIKDVCELLFRHIHMLNRASFIVDVWWFPILTPFKCIVFVLSRAANAKPSVTLTLMSASPALAGLFVIYALT